MIDAQAFSSNSGVSEALLDTFPPDAPINVLLGHLREQGACSVFSPEHQALATLFFSQRPQGKGLIFPTAWKILGALPRPVSERSVDILFVDNCRRHAHIQQAAARGLARDFAVGWLTHPIKKRKQAAEIPELRFFDPLFDLAPSAGPVAPDGGEEAALEVWRRTVKGNKIPWFTRPILSMNRQLRARASAFLLRRKVRAVVLGSDGEQIGSAVGAAAGTLGLPVLVLQHGTHNLHNYFGVSSRLMCWSHMGKTHVEEATRAFGVGRVPQLKVDVVGGILQVEDLPSPDGPVVLFLDQVSRYGDQIWGSLWIEESRRWLSYLGRELKGRARLILRTHPGYEPSPSQLPEGAEVSSGLSLKQDLQRASVVLAMNSTAGLEAGAMGRPPFFFRDPNMVWLGSLAPLENLIVSSMEETAEKIRPLLESSGAWSAAAAQARSLCREYLGDPEHTVENLQACIRSEVSA